MKKYLALLMAAIMVLSCLAGCGNKDTNTNTNTNANSSTNTNTNTNTNAPEVEGPHVGPDGRIAREDQTYHGIYSSELTTLNYLSTGVTYNLVVGANCIDPLVENDAYGNIVGCGAESWETSEDGLTWTFHLREGQKWYDYQGNEMGDVTAHDYVAGIRYVCDAT